MSIESMISSPVKAHAVRMTFGGKITENCPASVLRTHRNAHLYLDRNSAIYVKTEE